MPTISPLVSLPLIQLVCSLILNKTNFSPQKITNIEYEESFTKLVKKLETLTKKESHSKESLFSFTTSEFLKSTACKNNTEDTLTQIINAQGDFFLKGIPLENYKWGSYYNCLYYFLIGEIETGLVICKESFTTDDIGTFPLPAENIIKIAVDHLESKSESVNLLNPDVLREKIKEHKKAFQQAPKRKQVLTKAQAEALVKAQAVLGASSSQQIQGIQQVEVPELGDLSTSTPQVEANVKRKPDIVASSSQHVEEVKTYHQVQPIETVSSVTQTSGSDGPIGWLVAMVVLGIVGIGSWLWWRKHKTQVRKSEFEQAADIMRKYFD